MSLHHARASRRWLAALASLLFLGALAGPARGQEAAGRRDERGSIRAMQRLNVDQGFVLTDRALLFTRDGGASWSDATPPSSIRGVTDLLFLDESRGFLAGAAPGSPDRLSVLDTMNGGSSWRDQLVDASRLRDGQVYTRAQIFFADPKHGWLLGRVATSAAFSQGVLLRTSDGGETWERLSQPPAAGRVLFLDGERGFMSGAPVADRLYRTLDGGMSWEELTLGLGTARGRALYGLPVFHTAQDGALAVTLRGPRPRLMAFTSRDGGRTWRNHYVGTLPAGDYEEPVPVAFDDRGQPAVLGAFGSLTLVEGGRARSLSLARATVDRQARTGLVPSVQALSVEAGAPGWALLSEGACDTAGCRQVTRLVGVDGAGTVARDLVVRTDLQPLLTRTISGDLAPLGSTISRDKGFDKCAAPSVAQMQTWKTYGPYKDANVYFGGSARACAQTSLNASWVSAVFAQGWRLIPTWVGPQAPCSTLGNRFSYDVATARSQAASEADGAVAAAAALGLGAGSPLYYDLEAYSSGGTCSTAVRAFVDSWVQRVRAKGYVAGVYGAPRNAQADWHSSVIGNTPDAVWLAGWVCTGGTSCSFTPSVFGISGLSDTYWASNQRIRQYWGDHRETWGGTTFDIDSDYAAGPVAVAASEPPPTCTASVPAEHWKGEYFANRTLSGTASLVRSDGSGALAFEWGAGGPTTCGVGADNFSARWTRTVAFPAGVYRFTATTDDGVRLYVDNALTIDQWIDRAPVVDTAEVTLAAGDHVVQMEYYENAGGAVAKLSWEKIGDAPPPPTSIVVDDGPADAAGVLELLQTATGRPEWWHSETGVGYGNDMVWTTNTYGRQDNYARWKPKLPYAAEYKVEAYVPSSNANSERAKYVIVAGGASVNQIVNQNLVSDDWVDLGTYGFRADGTEYVELGDLTGETNNTRKVGFDALRFTALAAPPPPPCQAVVAASHWKGEYFANEDLSGSPILSRDDGDSGLTFDWGAGSPDATCGVPVDQFSARWSRTAAFSAGTHRFSITSDDGFRLYVDGTLRLEKWIDQAPTMFTVDVPLAAGDHALRLDYYENGGGAVAKLSWQLVATPPLLVDDGDAGFQLFGPAQWWTKDTTAGYGGDMVWTMNTYQVKENYARWTPSLPMAGSYKVEVYVPSNNATTLQARYSIVASGTTASRTVNQNAIYNDWVDIGTHAFRADGTEYVELADLTGETANTKKVGFDAVRFTLGSVAPPPAGGSWAFPVGTESGAGWRVTLGLGQSWVSSSGIAYNGHLAEDWAATSGATLGQPVFAAAAGEVVTVVQNCGNYVDVVVLRHDEQVNGENVHTMYGHIETTLRAGDRVGRRQQLGTIGNPVTFGPHLHFEVKNRTALVNPPFSSCSNTSQGVYISAGYSGKQNDFVGGDAWDLTDGVTGNTYFHPTRFIQKRLPATATARGRAPDTAEPGGPPLVPAAFDGLPRCEAVP